jgi:signal transduction histidine kinase
MNVQTLKPFKLTLYFTIASLIFTLLIAGLGMYLTSTETRESLLEQENQRLYLLARKIAAQLGTRIELKDPQPQQVQEVQETLYEEVRQHKVEGIEILNGRGEVVYSTDPARMGSKLPLDTAGLCEAFGGVHGLYFREGAYEFFAPYLFHRGRFLAAIRIFPSTSVIEGRVSTAASNIGQLILMSMFVLYGVLFLIVRRADRIITHRTELVNRTNQELAKANAEINELNQTLELKVLERTEALIKTNEELKASLKVKSEFLSTVSHELRTPLTAIIGFSDALLEGTCGPITPEQRECLTDIHNGGQHLLSLVTEILQASKLASGTVKFSPELVDLERFIHDIHNMFQFKLKEKEISWEYTKQGDRQVVVYADPTKIKQVISNLVDNAIKFTPRGGKIGIQVKMAGEDGTEVCVFDSGEGIDPKDQEKLFKEFSQVDSSHARRYGGTGLGLYICKKFVEMHRGRIWVESQRGKGSRFYFTIPHIESWLEKPGAAG